MHILSNLDVRIQQKLVISCMCMIDILFQGGESIKEGLARLIEAEVERIAATVTTQGEWLKGDAEFVLRSLAKTGLREGETLEQAILRGVQARAEVHTVGRVYVADKEGFVTGVRDRRGAHDQAQKNRVA